MGTFGIIERVWAMGSPGSSPGMGVNPNDGVAASKSSLPPCRLVIRSAGYRALTGHIDDLLAAGGAKH